MPNELNNSAIPVSLMEALAGSPPPQAPILPLLNAQPLPVAPPQMLPVETAPVEQVPVVEAPELVPTGRTTTSTKSKKETTEGIDRNISAMEGAKADQLKAFDDEMKAAGELGALEGKRQGEELKAMDAALVEKQKVETATKTLIDDSIAARNSAVAEFNQQPDTSFWGSKSTGDRVVLAIGLALGAFGSSISGGPNQALQVLNSIITDHNHNARIQAARRVKAVEIGRTGVADAQKFKRDELAKVAASELAARERIIKVLDVKSQGVKNEQQLAKLQQVKAQMETDLSSKLIDQEAQFAATASETVADQAVMTTPGGDEGLTDQGKALSEAQGKAQSLFAKSAPSIEFVEQYERNLSDDQFVELQSILAAEASTEGFAEIPVLGKGIPLARALTDSTTNERFGALPGGQEYLLHLRVASDALLRDESGAALTGSDLELQSRKFFPMKGDSVATLRAKARTRRNAVRGLRDKTGRIKSQPLWWEKKK